MGYWSVFTMGFDGEVDTLTAESAGSSASTALPGVSLEAYVPRTNCLHVTSPEWHFRESETNDSYPEAAMEFLETLSYDIEICAQLTVAAVVESEDTGSSHQATVFDVGDFSDPMKQARLFSNGELSEGEYCARLEAELRRAYDVSHKFRL